MNKKHESEAPEIIADPGESIWECVNNPDQYKIDALVKGRAKEPAFLEWAAIFEKAKSLGNPCDFVMEYRQLLHECKNETGGKEFLGRWENFWAVMLLAVEVATGRPSVAGSQWRLRFQHAVPPKNEEVEQRLSLLAEKALLAIKTAGGLKYGERKGFLFHTPPTPQFQMVVLAHWFCLNFQKDPRLLLAADRLELETLRLAAKEFSPARDKSL